MIIKPPHIVKNKTLCTFNNKPVTFLKFKDCINSPIFIHFLFLPKETDYWKKQGVYPRTEGNGYN